MSRDPHAQLSLTGLAPNPAHGKWRTEAMRSHETPHLIYFTKGQGRITVAGLTSGFGPNNLIFLPAKTMYGFETGPTVYGQILTIPHAMATEWPSDPAHLRLRDVLLQKEVISHFETMERELKSTEAASERAAHYQLGLFSIFFERQLASRDIATTDPRTKTAAARLAAAYTALVERHYTEAKTVAEYAAMLGVTPTHLTRCCREMSGKSALELLNDRVLFEARLMLRNGALPVRHVAQALGYGSAAYFARTFQAKTGLTPSQFRKKGPLSPQ